ncbi:Uncharacterised protein [Corynebacterium kutscheri]|uniref:DUF6882 domain-containing protein n=1 Tax=Corynebacterium kutscheri TaxID=35755 RepID=UPI000F6C86CF|nr:DUF6882 domain-containing protein [Corynebacterium kutscheri]VEH80221.1 Uncharacterised protein [Corynebacterium kutscheri]
MHLTDPTTLTEVVFDGHFARIEADESYRQLIPIPTEHHFRRTDDGYRVDAGDHSFAAQRVACVQDDQWQWQREAPFAVAELHGQLPATNELIDAARTVFGPGPAFLVPTDAGYDVIIIDCTILIPIRQTLALGLAHFNAQNSTAEIVRALTAYAGRRGLDIRVLHNQVDIAENGHIHSIDLTTRSLIGAMNIDELYARTALMSQESQFLFHARHPQPLCALNAKESTCTINNQIYHAVLVATLRDNVWRWSYDDPRTSKLPISQGALEIKRFATDYAIPELLRTETSSAQAQLLHFDEVAKPIIKHWAHAFVHFDDDTSALVLLDGPALRLPQPTVYATQATLNTLNDTTDRATAINSYALFRGIPLETDEFHTTATLSLSDGTIEVSLG